jgi:hypothetical protein
MSRKAALRRAAFALAALAVTSSSLVFADDNSMSRLTGDSYAFFNNLDFSPGKFNTAKATASDGDTSVAKAGKDNGRDVGKAEQRPTSARPSSAASRVFRNDTGA